eukprot:8153542-Prorocentrum_lima.AAC.1
MVVVVALDKFDYKDDWFEDLPSRTPQFLGLLVDVAVDRLVHELDIVHGLDLVQELDPVHELS